MLAVAKILPASSRTAGDRFWLDQTRTVHTATAAAYGVITVANPDDMTIRRFPFKMAKVGVTPKAGEIGFYDCRVEVLPHIQFEGMNVELRLEARLG